MKYGELEGVIESVAHYKAQVSKVLQGDEELKNIKPTLGGMGVYEQREKGTFMLRVRVPAGILSIEALQDIVAIGKQVKVPRFHLTSRQDIQFHGLSLAGTIEVMEVLLEKGLVTTGGGGNNPRNVACSPLSGVEKGEVFDVVPYVLKACDYIMAHLTSYHLPRKYKIAFSNSEKDHANATATDLGFVAIEKEGKHFFKIFGGGGMGRNAKAGIVLVEALPTAEILYYIQGMKRLFETHGNYEDRNKARIRYIVEKLGEKKFVETLKEYVAEVKAEGNLVVSIDEVGSNQELNSQVATCHGKGNENRMTQEEAHLIPQKQQGLYSIFVHPLGGYVSSEVLESMTQVLAKFKRASLRLTMNQGFYIINLTKEEAEQVEALTAAIHVKGVMGSLTACTGANTCQIGIAPTEELIHLIEEHFRDIALEVQEVLPPLHISGCLNSCAAHQVATLGLCGQKKRLGDQVKNVFMLHINGHKDLSGATLSQEVGLLALEEVPIFLEKLAVKLKNGELSLEKEKIVDKLDKYFIK